MQIILILRKNRKYNHYYCHCKKRMNIDLKENSFDFNLTKQYLKDIYPEDNKCPALGIEFKLGTEGGRATSPSVDRIDNSKGYIKGNIIWVSSLANMIMTSATPQQVLDVGKFFKNQMENRRDYLK